MQSLYSVIKNTSIVKTGKKEIVTEYIPPEAEEIKIQKEVNAKGSFDSYENLARTMLENSRKQGEDILSKAYEEAEKIESEAYPNAYKKGYEEGKEKGYNDAYETAYKSNLEKAEKEGQSLIKEAQKTSEDIVKDAKEEYAKYLEDKKEELKKLVENIVENILKREIKDRNYRKRNFYD